MVVKVWVTPRADSSCLSSAEKDALIATLLARIDELGKRLAVLEVENAAVRAKLDLPPKTPDNSSTPPSQGRKASSATTTKPKGKPHVGAHRPLHPNPTRHRNVRLALGFGDRKSTRLNSSHANISYAVFCLK